MDRQIRGEGTPSNEWLSWFAAAQPPLAKLTPPARAARLVVVAPHPDDEVLTCAGLLRHHAEAGGECLVIAVTDGEASHLDVPGIAADELRATRKAESLAGLAALGLDRRSVARFGLPDGGVAKHRLRLVCQLSTLLRRGDCVVTTWRLDGHPDHEATGECVAEASRALGCRLLEAPVWMWHWAKPAQPGIPWERLRTHALRAGDIDRKRQALACHASQLAQRGPSRGPVLADNLLARAAWPQECYFIGGEAP